MASEKDINWLNSYSKIESLKREFTKTNFLMENHYSENIESKNKTNVILLPLNIIAVK